jgi:Galactosyltransferase
MTSITQKRSFTSTMSNGNGGMNSHKTTTLLPHTKRGTTNSGNGVGVGVAINNSTKYIMSSSCLNLIFIGTLTVALAFQIYGTATSFQKHTLHHGNGTNLHKRTLLNNLCPTTTTTTEVTSSVTNQQQRQISGTNLDGETSSKYRIGALPHTGRLRVLMGIVSADFFNDQVYRKRHRTLFTLWNDPRVCSLPEFKSKPLAERYICELIYTFVIGANPDETPELVDNSRPFEVQRPIKGVSRDLNEPDTTLLNIRENMNEGKSQTWMYYASQIAEQYDLDYVAKCDADSILHLHEFFRFAYKNMPPAPYNSMMYIGALRDKAYWPKHTTDEERVRYESYFGKTYDGVHLYVAGQLYIMATDLAKFVGQEALQSKCSYCEGHEDHDISALAFHSPEPIKLVVIGRTHRFWEHPVKGEPRWKRIKAREEARMAGTLFEGRMFTTNSTIGDVLGSDRVAM